MGHRIVAAIALAAMVAVPTAARTETPEAWIALGTRVHGGFGAFIPVGIRIGLDALHRLDAKPREVTVDYYDNAKIPCACIADGVAIATVASVGQRSLRIAMEPAPADAMAVIVVRRKQGGPSVKYTVPGYWPAKLAEWNRTLDPRGRYDAVMAAEGLFEVSFEN